MDKVMYGSDLKSYKCPAYQVDYVLMRYTFIVKNIDDTDRKILEILCTDARASICEKARRMGHCIQQFMTIYVDLNVRYNSRYTIRIGYKKFMLSDNSINQGKC